MFAEEPAEPEPDAAWGWLEALNGPQRAAVLHGDGPLLILAGAGTGKTTTLAARVARLLADGVAPPGILLLTFTRRAAEEMLRRAETMSARAGAGVHGGKVVGGTFHAVANRLLRRHGHALGLGCDFGVLDQADSADLVDLVRDDLGVAGGRTRFPRKATLAAVYSRVVNAREKVADVVARDHPWAVDHSEAIAAVLRGYVARKRARHLLDYDDLLLWWRALLDVPGVGEEVADGFDHVLVDEYQDTNALQAEILAALRRRNRNLTVVGDDAQAVYGFRAATVENILGFPDRFPGAAVIALEQSYRSTQGILDVANAVIAEAPEQWDKALWSEFPPGARPRLHTCADEAEQSDRVCAAVLAAREAGVALHDQAVLVRAGHHTAHLELELARRGIPFVKYGGLKFLEAAHVKDALAVLRILDNPFDEVAWFRLLQLLEGVGPRAARKVMAALGLQGPDPRDPTAEETAAPAGRPADAGATPLSRLLEEPPPVPLAARDELAGLVLAFADCLAGPPVGAQLERIRRWYAPLCARLYGDAAVRLADLRQLEVVAGGQPDRRRFLDDLVLDPPASTSDLAGPPLLDEDWLVLSTIHSAKGLEWEHVHVLHCTDGHIPSDMATGSDAEVAEERRLLYVALTRARRELDVYAPLRYHHDRLGTRDRHSWGQLSRFLTGSARPLLQPVGPTYTLTPDPPIPAGGRAGTRAIDALLDELLR